MRYPGPDNRCSNISEQGGITHTLFRRPYVKPFKRVVVWNGPSLSASLVPRLTGIKSVVRYAGGEIGCGV